MVDEQGQVHEERRRQQRKECQTCHVGMHGVCAGHALMEFEMRVRKWAERTLLVVLLGLFSTMAGLFWRMSGFSDSVKETVAAEARTTRGELTAFATRLETIATRQDEVFRRLPVIEGRSHSHGIGEPAR